MDIRDFNIKLAGFIKDAKRMEKTDSKKARVLWLKIAEFALEFSKQTNIDRSFKLKLWKQIDTIIKRVKPIEMQVSPPNFVESLRQDSISQQPSNTNFDFNQFPSVPNDEDNISPSKPFIDTPKNDEDKDEKINEDEGFYSKILKMEEDLKQMPDFIKEVNVKSYNSDESIIPFSKSILQTSNDDESEKINLQPSVSALDLGSNTREGYNINTNKNNDTDYIDPYKGTKDMDKIIDPFSPEVPEVPGVNVVFCYACGAPVPPNSKRCPKCSAEL